MSAAAKKAAAVASRPSLSLTEAIRIHDALHDDNRTSVIIQGQKLPIQLTTKDNLRHLYIFGIQVMVQNPFKRNSEHARRAALGHKLTWFMTKPRWGCIEDRNVIQKCWLINMDKSDDNEPEEYTDAPTMGPVKDEKEEEEDVDDDAPPAKRRKIAEDENAELSPKFEEETEHDDNMFPDPPDVVRNVKVEEPASAESSASTGALFPDPAPITGLPKKLEPADNVDAAGEEENSDNRPLCKYHPNCYRKNLDHWKQFRHPGKPAPSTGTSTSGLPPTVPHDPVPPAGKKTAVVKSSGSKGSSNSNPPARIVDDEDDAKPVAVKKEPLAASADKLPAAVASNDNSNSGGVSGSSGMSSTLQSWEIRFDEIQLGPKLGSGAFGEVRLGTWMGTDVAVKILHANDDKSKDEFFKEANLLCQFRHPNIIPFLGACLQGQLAIVMELMPSSLTKLIKAGPIELKLLCRIASGITRGIIFLHNSKPKIIHRDLKPDNILLDHSNNPKLADFGVSREKIATQEMTRIGTPSYCAPEILKGEKYSEKVDIFSFGMILYAMTTGRAPFRGGEGDQPLSPLQIMMKIAVQKERPKIPADVNCPTWLRDLMNECWDSNPDKRPNADDILKRIQANAPK